MNAKQPASSLHPAIMKTYQHEYLTAKESFLNFEMLHDDKHAGNSTPDLVTVKQDKDMVQLPSVVAAPERLHIFGQPKSTRI